MDLFLPLVQSVISFIKRIGTGELGQLGLGPTETFTTSPKRVKGVLEKKIVTLISAGKRHFACLTADKEVYTFGKRAPRFINP